MTREEMIALFKATKQTVARGAQKAGDALNPSKAIERAVQRAQDKRLAERAAEDKGKDLNQLVKERLAPTTEEIEQTTERGGAGASGVESNADVVPAEENANLGSEGMSEEEIKAMSHAYGGTNPLKLNEAQKLRLQKALDNIR